MIRLMIEYDFSLEKRFLRNLMFLAERENRCKKTIFKHKSKYNYSSVNIEIRSGSWTYFSIVERDTYFRL